MEIWKEIEGYEGYYEVSNLGNVRSLDRYVDNGKGGVSLRKGRTKVQTPNTDGYMQVTFSKDGRDIKRRVHKLVADAFVDGYFDSAVVDHKDGNITNNSSENLEWVTQAENVRRSIERGSHVSCWCDYNGENNPNYGNDTLRKRYAEDKAFAIEKQGRPGGKNGRAVKTSVRFDDELISFDTMTDAASYVMSELQLNYKPQCLATRIPRLIESNKDYHGYYFAFV